MNIYNIPKSLQYPQEVLLPPFYWWEIGVQKSTTCSRLVIKGTRTWFQSSASKNTGLSYQPTAFTPWKILGFQKRSDIGGIQTGIPGTEAGGSHGKHTLHGGGKEDHRPFEWKGEAKGDRTGSPLGGRLPATTLTLGQSRLCSSSSDEMSLSGQDLSTRLNTSCLKVFAIPNSTICMYMICVACVPHVTCSKAAMSYTTDREE